MKWFYFLLFICLLKASLLTALPRVEIPASVDPTRVEQALPAPASPQPDAEIKVAPGAPSLMRGAKEIKFIIRHITLQGVTVYSEKALLRLFPYPMGTLISVADLEEFVSALTAHYRRDGYILSQAILPPQSIQEGQVTIQLIEGYVDHVQIEGKVNNPLLKKYGEKIAMARPLSMAVLERYALLANDIPGMEVKTFLAPSSHTPGAADLTFIADQKRGDLYASLDNRNTPFLGPNVFFVQGDLNGLINGSDNAGIRFSSSDGNKLRYIAVSGKHLIKGTQGLFVDAQGEVTRTHPGLLLAPLAIQGDSTDLTARLSYPLIRLRKRTLFLYTEANYLNSRADILSDFPFYEDRTRSLKVGSRYNAVDSYWGVNEFNVELAKGFDVLGASRTDSALSHPEGHANYFSMTAGWARTQTLPCDFSLLVAAQGQYAWVPLLAAQQFGFGGAFFGRGYDPSEITGDRGVAGKVELRYNMQLRMMGLRAIQYFTFYDAGVVWNIDKVDFPWRQSGTSTGIGARIQFTRWLTGSLELDQPLTRGVLSHNNSRHSRGFFSVAVQF